MTARFWLVNRRFDLIFFIFPALLGLLLAVPAFLNPHAFEELPLWAWILCVLGVDVAHVWSTLFRVYLDPIERRRRRLYLWAPLLVWGASTVIYGISAALFWTLLAYLAVYHFIKQQFGFISLYRVRGGQFGAREKRLDQLALWAGTGFPILWWHCHLPREIAWFMPGDFIPGLPPGILTWLWPIYLGIGLFWIAYRAHQSLVHGAWNPGRDAVMVLTWATWYVGIIPLDLDYIFTVTNIFIHGIPYGALVWITSRQSPRADNADFRVLHKAPVFMLIILALAYGEEFLWDTLFWHEHPQIFGGLGDWIPDEDWLAWLFIPLLSLPQATHYILDGYIWKMDGSNPGLKEKLIVDPPA